ncbi:MAG: iron-containing alcohol dehydrogenase [Firmicutes bacterium]|nr:iron-containing alcohol dehydrogenase [Bacillota bacterium]
MKDFIFRMPTKIRFGVGSTQNIGSVLKDEMGYQKAFVATDKGIVNAGIIAKIEEGLQAGDMEYVIYDELIPEPTVEVVDQAAEVLRESGADVVIAVGGGSPIDTAKAMCLLQTHEGSCRDYLFGGTKTVSAPIMPLVAVPTTAGTGSELTAASVISNEQERTKVSITSDYLIPKMVFVDPSLQLGMPPFITATTGMDALTHAIEAYVSLNASPISDMCALQAIEMIGKNLRTAVSAGSNLEARCNMAIASTIAGAAFMNGGLGVVHGIAQTIGAFAHVAHGTANALLLPYCMERNVVGNLEKFKNIAVALGENVEGLSLREAADAAVDAVFRLVQDLRIPMTLKEVGVCRGMFGDIARDVMNYRLLAVNPCKITEKDVIEILENAYE